MSTAKKAVSVPPKATKHRRNRAAAARPEKRKKLARAERATQMRARILDAAEKIVRERGYQNASVGRIAIEAEVAQGTIYLYFETRQHLLDELLPYAGQKAMKYIGGAIRGARNFREVEQRAVIAFFEYMRDNPGYDRVLNEAQFAAPAGHRKHFEELIARYVASMKQSVRDGSLQEHTDTELEVAAYTMMAARSYLWTAYVKYGKFDMPPKEVIDAYLECHYLIQNNEPAQA